MVILVVVVVVESRESRREQRKASQARLMFGHFFVVLDGGSRLCIIYTICVGLGVRARISCVRLSPVVQRKYNPGRRLAYPRFKLSRTTPVKADKPT